jgi:hypothetical protein
MHGDWMRDSNISRRLSQGSLNSSHFNTTPAHRAEDVGC